MPPDRRHPRVLAAGAPAAVDEAARVLAGGGLVVIPTDTVYGVAARIDRPEAVRRIFELKGRPREKALPVLVADLETARRLAVFTPQALELAATGWPGPLTLVLERGALAADLGGDGRTVALRIPDHPAALELLARAGPLAATSANPSGRPPHRSVEEIAASLGEGVDLYLDGGRLGSTPSRVISLVGEPRVLRE